MSFPWNNEEAAAQKKKKGHQNTPTDIFFNDDAPAARRSKAPLQPASYNIISGDAHLNSAADRQPRSEQWNANDYVVHKAKGAAQNMGESPFVDGQNQQPTERFARAPKCGDFNAHQSNQAYRTNRQNAQALRSRTQQSEAGACIFGK
jgi:hypothetical protein